MWSTWNSALQEAYREIFVRLGEFIPRVFGALVIFGIGWLVAWLLQKLVDSVLRGVLDPIWEVTRLEDLRKKTQLKLDMTGLVARLLFWIVLAIAFIAAMEVLGLSSIADLFNQVVGYVPNVLAALVILVVGLILANFLRETVRATVTASELPHAQLLGAITYWAVVVFIVIAGLIQLGIAKELLMILFQGVVVALAISLGLAFGLGGQRWASGVINSLTNEVREEKEKQMESEEEI